MLACLEQALCEGEIASPVATAAAAAANTDVDAALSVYAFPQPPHFCWGKHTTFLCLFSVHDGALQVGPNWLCMLATYGLILTPTLALVIYV